MSDPDTESGTERIQFTCNDCGKDVDREPHQLDVDGLTPARCIQCTFDKMAEGTR